MKIKIVKEADDMYFVKVLNHTWYFAQWRTIEEALQNLEYNIEDVNIVNKELTREKNKKRLFAIRKPIVDLSYISKLRNLSFNRIVFSV